MTSEQDKKYILKEYLRNISHLADPEYQKRVWVQAEGAEIDDFDETCCHFFDDGDPILKKYQEYSIDENQFRLLLKLRNAFETFVNADRPYLPEEFIDSQEWDEIREMAKEVLKVFNYSVRTKD